MVVAEVAFGADAVVVAAVEAVVAVEAVGRAILLGAQVDLPNARRGVD